MLFSFIERKIKQAASEEQFGKTYFASNDTLLKGGMQNNDNEILHTDLANKEDPNKMESILLGKHFDYMRQIRININLRQKKHIYSYLFFLGFYMSKGRNIFVHLCSTQIIHKGTVIIEARFQST